MPGRMKAKFIGPLMSIEAAKSAKPSAPNTAQAKSAKPKVAPATQ